MCDVSLIIFAVSNQVKVSISNLYGLQKILKWKKEKENHLRTLVCLGSMTSKTYLYNWAITFLFGHVSLSETHMITCLKFCVCGATAVKSLLVGLGMWTWESG